MEVLVEDEGGVVMDAVVVAVTSGQLGPVWALRIPSSE